MRRTDFRDVMKGEEVRIGGRDPRALVPVGLPWPEGRDRAVQSGNGVSGPALGCRAEFLLSPTLRPASLAHLVGSTAGCLCSVLPWKAAEPV